MSAELGARTTLAAGRDRGRRGLADLVATLRRWVALARGRWRRLLQLRVVTTTMLLGLFVVSLLGGVLHEQIAAALEKDRVRSAEDERSGSAARPRSSGTTRPRRPSTSSTRPPATSSRPLAARPEPSRYVVMSRSAGNDR